MNTEGARADLDRLSRQLLNQGICDNVPDAVRAAIYLLAAAHKVELADVRSGELALA